MKLVRTTCAAVLASLVPGFAAVVLDGRILQLDSLPKPGVVVSLSGTSLKDTTDADGKWSLSDGTTGILGRAVSARPVSNHLLLRNGRIQLSLAGRDVLGRNPASPAVGFATSARPAARSAATGFDTLVYSWNGKTILRDTIAHAALERQGIFRYFDTTVNPAITHGYVSDAQGHLYRTVTIGDQVWMAQNLRMKVDSSWCTMDSASLCPRYGRLYQWSSVFGIASSFNYSTRGKGTIALQGLCPSGWRIPSDADFATLLKTVDSARSSALLRSTDGWTMEGGGDTVILAGRDSLGFNVPASGYRNSDGSFGNLHTHVAFWSTTESEIANPFRQGTIGSFAWTGHFYVKYQGMIRWENYKDLGLSVRCIEGHGLEN